MSEQSDGRPPGGWDGDDTAPAGSGYGPAYGGEPSGGPAYGEQPAGGQQPPGGPAYGVHSSSPEYGAQPPTVEPPVFDITPGATIVPAAPARRRPMLPVLGTVLVVVALVLAGVGIKRFAAGSASAIAPAAYAPSTTFAYAQVHLDPSSSQKLALFNFSRLFPNSPTNKPGADVDGVRDTLLGAIFKNTPVVYDVDIKPWLGDFAAVAGFTDLSGKPQVVGIVAVRDRGKATTTLRRVEQTAHLAFGFHGSYVLIAPDNTALAAAQTELARGKLSDNATFTSDVKTLPSDELVLAWGDGARIAQVAKSSNGGCGWLPFAGGTAMVGGRSTATLPTVCSPAAFDNALKLYGGKPGRLVVGAKVGSNGVDVQYRARGQQSTMATADLSPMLSALPGNTAVAVALGPSKPLLDQIDKALKAMAPAVGAAMSGAGGPGGPGSAKGGDPMAEIKQAIRDATGLSFPDDFATLLGDRSVGWIARVPGAGPNSTGDIGLRTHPTDMALAQQLARRLGHKIAASGGPPVAIEPDGGDLVMKISDPQSAGQGSGALESSARYQAAMAPTGSALMAAYVDFRALQIASRDIPINALGLVVGKQGSDVVVEMRLVTR